MDTPLPSSQSRAEGVKRFLVRNPAIAVTLLYLLTTAIGVSYAWMHFDRFGIDIFQFWQPSDLVLAGFREPASFVLAVFLAIYSWWAYRDAATQRARIEAKVREYETRERQERLGWYAGMRLSQFRTHLRMLDAPPAPWRRWLSMGTVDASRAGFFVGLGVFMFLVIAHAHISMRSRFPHHWFPRIDLVLLEQQVPFRDPVLDPQLLIGASNSFLFLRSQHGGEVTVVPLSSVGTLQVHAPQGRFWERFAP